MKIKTAADLTKAIQASFEGKPTANLKLKQGKTTLNAADIECTELLGNLAVLNYGKIGQCISAVSAVIGNIQNTKFLRMPMQRWMKFYMQSPKSWKEAVFLLKIQIVSADTLEALNALREALQKKKVWPDELNEAADITAIKLRSRK